MSAAAELHIASLVVHAAPVHNQDVVAAIAQMPMAQIHATTAAGKLVVTLESSSSDEMTAAITAIQQLPGVLSAMLVYQCVDSLESMNEEMSDA